MTGSPVDGSSDVDTDVVVVGAGVAGLGAAQTLAAHGLDVVILERESEPGGDYLAFSAISGPYESGVRAARQILNGLGC